MRLGEYSAMAQLLRHPPGRILVIKTEGGIGDLLMATPLLSTLRHHYPAARIEVMVKPSFADLLEGNPAIDVVWPLQPKERSLLQLAGAFRRRRYDLGIVLWSTSRLAWAMALGEIPLRVGEAGRLGYSWLFTHRVRRRPYVEGSPESHQVEQMLDYGRALGLEARHDGLVVAVPSEAAANVDRLLAGAGVAPGERLIGLHIGKGMDVRSRGWPVANFAELADELAARFGAKVVVTGGEHELEMVRDLAGMVRRPVVDLAGKTTLRELAALARRCALFICPDSGPAHIAAAMKVPTVSIFALKSDFPSRWRPFGTRSEIVRKITECGRVCIKEICPDFICMHEIRAADVLPAVERLLSACTSPST